MKWEDINRQSCSVARSLCDIGERWTLLLIRDAMGGATKFEDFVERSGAGRNLVADRLCKLVTAGILKAELYQEKPDRFSYVLTEKGVDLYPVLMALVRWGDKWHDDGAGPPVLHYHNTCGQQMHAVFTCSACAEEIDPMETRFVQCRRGIPERTAKRVVAVLEKQGRTLDGLSSVQDGDDQALLTCYDAAGRTPKTRVVNPGKLRSDERVAGGCLGSSKARFGSIWKACRLDFARGQDRVMGALGRRRILSWK